MSIRYGLLALLERAPMYGYQLRKNFEASTGSTWPLNIGQVYTTLERLERDGCVESADEPGPEGRVMYRITDAGRLAIAAWFTSPIRTGDRPRDELAIKVSLALATPGVDVNSVVQIQRTATLKHLQELTRLKLSADEADDTAWLLVLDSMIFRAEAEVRWLDHSEVRLSRRPAEPPAPPAPTPQPARRTASETKR